MSLLLVLLAGPALAKGPDYGAAATRARTLLGELVAADTTNPPGNEARAIALGAARLKAAGIPFERFEFAPGRENLVARIKGTGAKRPLLLLAHVDVVGTAGQAWSTDPHRMAEVNGYLQGRGVSDDLGSAAASLEAFLLLAQSGVKLERDVILAWTGDEESGGDGIQWILKNRPELVGAEIAVNEGGGVVLDKAGQPKFIAVSAAEKTYQDFVITARGTTGHSSVPLGDNAIFRLARALERLSQHRFPVRLPEVTRAYLAARAQVEAPAMAEAMRAAAQAKGDVLPEPVLAVLDKEPMMAALLRTTCVPTLLNGGTRENALPAVASVTVNCRILPVESVASTQQAIVEALADPGLEVTLIKAMGPGGASPVSGPGMDALRKVSAQLYPKLPVVPSLSLGASDSRYLRTAGIAAYGMNPIPRTEEDSRRAHGIDERIPAASLQPGIEYLYRLVLELGGAR